MESEKYNKFDKNVRDLEKINKYLADAKLPALGDRDEVFITLQNM